MELYLSPETIAFLLLELDDILNHCNLEEIVYEDIANLINLLANTGQGSIHLNL
jgi:hypothetical protein